MAAPDNALQSAKLILKIGSEQSGRAKQKTLATAYWISAGALLNLNRVKEATVAADAGLTAIGSINPSSLVYGRLLLVRGDIAWGTRDARRALNAYQAAFRTFEELGDAHGQAVALEDIGAAYVDAGDYDSALKYARQALQTYTDDPMFVLFVHTNSGSALVELGKYFEAENEFRLALEAEQKLNSPLLRAKILENLARAQAIAREYADAERTLSQAFAITTSGPAQSVRPGLLGVAAQVALGRGDYVTSARLIADAFASRSPLSPTHLRDFHHTAYQAFRNLGNKKEALAHLEIYKALDDQARALAVSTNAALLSAQFDFANQDLKITRLRAGQVERDAMIAQSRARLRAIITAGLLAAAAIISTLLAIGFVSIRRSRDQVRTANRALQGTNADLEKALAAKTEFLATTSHEIRTPLNGILGMTQVLLAERGGDALLRDRIQLIHGAGETMRALVDDILDVAKMETGKLRVHALEMDLPRLLADAATVWEGQAKTKGIAILSDLDAAPRGIVADEVRLRQIVFNLLSNATKFTDRGTVRLAATAESRDGAEHLVIRVADSGTGIPADRLADIFESFRQVDGGTTRRHGGTGLGLAICRSLARLMGGDVTVDSVLGVGSTFTLDLPLVRADAPIARPARARGAIASLADAVLLVVEANPLNRGVLRALLAAHVRGLRIVGDGDEALAALAAGDVGHLLADGATLRLDTGAAGLLARAAEAAEARMTLLWPAPDAATAAALAAEGIVQLVPKPIAATDLLAALKMPYAPNVADRDIAA